MKRQRRHWRLLREVGETLKTNPALGYFALQHLLDVEFGEGSILIPGNRHAGRGGLNHDAWVRRSGRRRAVEVKAVASARGWFDICEPDMNASALFVSNFRPCFAGDPGLMPEVSVFSVSAVRKWHARGWRGAELARVKKDARATYVVDLVTGRATAIT